VSHVEASACLTEITEDFLALQSSKSKSLLCGMADESSEEGSESDLSEPDPPALQVD
jgi:hypothetical protein